MSFKVGDRVVITKVNDNLFGHEGIVVLSYYGMYYGIRLDGINLPAIFLEDQLELIPHSRTKNQTSSKFKTGDIIVHKDEQDFNEAKEYIVVSTIGPYGSIEVESVISAFNRLYIDPEYFVLSPKLKNKQPEVKSCSHEWKFYQGLTEQYNFCTKCDKKQETVNA